MSLAAQAAVQVTYNGEPVAAGQTLAFIKDNIRIVEGMPFTAYKMEEKITVTGTAPITVSLVGNNDVISYCVGNNCYSLANDGSGKYTAGSTLTQNTSVIDIDTALFPNEIPDVKATVEFTLTDAAGASTNFTVTLDSSTGSVANIEADKVIVKAQGKTIVYSVGTPTPLTVYSLAGNTILKRTLEGTGTVSLTSYPAGIYLYRAGSHTGKIIIR